MSGTRTTSGTSVSPEPETLGTPEVPEMSMSPETPVSPEAPEIPEVPENSPEALDASSGTVSGTRGSSSSC